jgi:hypothetical protein
MDGSPITQNSRDVPSLVFGKFLEDLARAGASAELITRLRTALLEDKTFTERALREAILNEELVQ